MDNVSCPVKKLRHGGQLREAAARYHIPLEQWIDLSTGINPHSWPVKDVTADIWRRLPENDDELVNVACQYYNAPSLLPVAGSQAAIQVLPQLREPSRVSILYPSYAEHARAWQRANHTVNAVTFEQIKQAVPKTDILIIINPNNPTGAVFSVEQLLDWHALLAQRGGWLIVDEAFMDAIPEQSMASFTACPGLIVLRSLGKLFGLAGARVGFVCADKIVLSQLDEALGPWTISTASRWVAIQALRDTVWQTQMRHNLADESKRLHFLLSKHHLTPDGGCAFFKWVKTVHAKAIHENLARQGILTRLFDVPQSLRFGLPGVESEWDRLDIALARANDRITSTKG